MSNDEVLSWTCSKCGKVINSLYQNQLDTNIQHHEAIHDLVDVGDKKE